jgi:hypothetical protein
VQLGKFPVITSYYFVLGGESELVMLICPYLSGGTLVGGKTSTSKIHPRSHLFVCCVESLSVDVHQIGLLLQFFNQASRYVGQLRGVILSFANMVQITPLCILHKTNPISSKVVTSN